MKHSSPQSVEFTLPSVSVGVKKVRTRRVPHSPNSLFYMHWATRARWAAEWKQAAWLEARQAVGKRLKGKAKVMVTLYVMSPMDEDNAMASLKPIVDGIKEAVLIDDSPEFCEIAKPVTVQVKHKIEEKVTVRIEY